MSRSPRLLFVVNADWFFVSHRLRLALACQREGYDVALCAGESDAQAQLAAHGIRFFPLPIDRGGTHPLRDARTLTSLLASYQAFSPDLVHHVTIKPVLYGSVAARSLGVRGIINAVSGLGYAFIPRQPDRLRHAALRTVLRTAYRAALLGPRTRIIFQNEDDQRMFVDLGLVRPSDTRLIRGSGVDLDLFKPGPDPSDPFLALVPSRLLWDKGVGEFVHAARVLKSRYPQARFVLLGRLDSGNPAAISHRQVEEWVAEGVIEWWPSQSHSKMPALLSQAHVVVLPSYREGLPLALAEAAAAGRAIITTDVPGCRDTIIDGQTGWLVPVRNAASLTRAIEQALTSPGELRERGRRARALAEQRFAVDAVIQRTLAIYQELLGGVGP